jgi:hypothetical protein
MADEKKPMQADGTGGVGEEIAAEKSPAAAGRPDMQDNEGDSGGGPYPSPHNDPANAHPENTFMGHGGQSDMRYYGDGQLGPDEVGEPENAVTEDED